MEFDQTNKVIISTLDEAEARAFVKFLQSEIKRHEYDIDKAVELIDIVRRKFNIE